MPSKGIQVYTYIAVPGVTIELSVPKQNVVKTDQRVFSNMDMEVDARNIDSFFDKTGRFSFCVKQNGALLTEQWAEVNAMTGLLGAGTMNTIANTASVVTPGAIVQYSLYAAGSGREGLPSRHQCNITVTPNYSGWIGSLAPAGSPQADRPFARLVLPSAHDVGMNSMQNCEVILTHAGGAVVGTLVHDAKLMQQIADVVTGPAVGLIAPNIIRSLAVTQKDTLSTMLALGARYFEFRPSHCHRDVLPVHAIPDRLYFQHSAIPGMAYELFLSDVVAFLLAHPTEVVVVQLRWDGVPAECARPSDAEQAEYLRAALAPAHGAVEAGGLADLHCSIAQLRAQKKRLLLLVNADALSTYTDLGNATLTGDSIVAAFGTVLSPQKFAGRAFVNIQCQATATNIPGAVAYSVLSAAASTSCSLATKALCDAKTLPWVRDNVVRAVGEGEMVVVMNDFLDGATADVCVGLSRARLG